ncbi:MAG: hypothetical protein L3K19_04090 [Thermoplasmata archaeon]|nr:hypothetical protein [Thermoplasmata archaeon]
MHGAQDDVEDAERRRRRRQGTVVAGLLLTLAGLYALIAILPSDPVALNHDLPYLGAGIIALWVGGILLGLGKGKGRRPPR